MSAKAPEEAGEFAWRATQTYKDGTVVEWTGSPDSEEPTPVVRVAKSSSETNEQGAGAEETTSGNSRGTGEAESTTGQDRNVLPDSGGSGTTILYAGLLGALALGAALLVLRRRA